MHGRILLEWCIIIIDIYILLIYMLLEVASSGGRHGAGTEKKNDNDYVNNNSK